MPCAWSWGGRGGRCRCGHRMIRCHYMICRGEEGVGGLEEKPATDAELGKDGRLGIEPAQIWGRPPGLSSPLVTTPKSSALVPNPLSSTTPESNPPRQWMDGRGDRGISTLLLHLTTAAGEGPLHLLAGSANVRKRMGGGWGIGGRGASANAPTLSAAERQNYRPNASASRRGPCSSSRAHPAVALTRR